MISSLMSSQYSRSVDQAAMVDDRAYRILASVMDSKSIKKEK
ncbi:hypothetical protein [Microcoleus sp. BR0-C5]